MGSVYVEGVTENGRGLNFSLTGSVDLGSSLDIHKPSLYNTAITQ